MFQPFWGHEIFGVVVVSAWESGECDWGRAGAMEENREMLVGYGEKVVSWTHPAIQDHSIHD